MTVAFGRKAKQYQDAVARTNALIAAMPRHLCHCGKFGCFRFRPDGPWFCFAHTMIGSDGLRQPILPS